MFRGAFVDIFFLFLSVIGSGKTVNMGLYYTGFVVAVMTCVGG